MSFLTTGHKNYSSTTAALQEQLLKKALDHAVGLKCHCRFSRNTLPLRCIRECKGPTVYDGGSCENKPLQNGCRPATLPFLVTRREIRD